MFGASRKIIGNLIKEICGRYGVEVVEGHVMPDHVHSVPRSGRHQEGDATCCM